MILPRNENIAHEQRHFFFKVYLWMFSGLVLSGLSAAGVAFTPGLARFVIGNMAVFWFLALVEIAMVFGLASQIGKLSGQEAVAYFLGYCFMSGLTLSVIFLVYSMNSIISLFFVTAGIFGIMGAFGYLTDHDLTSWGHVLLSGLVGIVLASAVNLLWRNSVLDWWVDVVGVVVFTGLIAYDTQKLRALDVAGTVEDSDQETREAIMGALALYLDFVNLFLKLLRLFGKRR